LMSMMIRSFSLKQDLNFGFNMKKTNKLNTNAKTMTRKV